MDRYMIEVPHESEKIACARVVKTFLDTGSHYLTHADWGCHDGVHKAWMIVEASDAEEAQWIVPAPMRSEAKVVRLSKFNNEDIDEILRDHDG